MNANANNAAASKIVVSFRGQKTEFPLVQGLTVGDVKTNLVSTADPNLRLTMQDIKLLHKSKVLSVNGQELYELMRSEKKRLKVYRLMATGVSSAEAQTNNEEFANGLRNAPRIRDDLTVTGKEHTARRQQQARQMMQNVKDRSSNEPMYNFGRIETLPMLSNEKTARKILTTLANDPGILACMAKHKWDVGSLAELYPEGKVGESDVCVMGLNKNKGQQILLRIRTDDLKGFRKIISIRKVLFHELAHNIHSDHDANFFQLMRQLERECNEMDWTQGQGLSSSVDTDTASVLFRGGTYRLGGADTTQ